MTAEKIERLWSGYRFNNCDTCNRESCKGRLDYDNLCSNLNYLKEYGQKNYEKNAEVFGELKRIMGSERPTIFSFGSGIGLDYIGAQESFGEDVGYLPIEECEWAITKTEPYRNFRPRLPRDPLSYKEGINLLRVARKNVVVCFFNSLFTISENTDLRRELVDALSNNTNFYIVCNYTMNNNFHLPSTEMKFLGSIIRKLRENFSVRQYDCLGGKGIIIKGERK